MQEINLHLNVLKQALIERKTDLAKQLTSQSHIASRKQAASEEAVDLRSELIHILADGLVQSDEEGEAFISKWAEKVAHTAIRYGAPMEEALKTVKVYRSFIWNAFYKIGEEKGLSAALIIEAIHSIHSLLDQAVYVFSLVYVKMFQENLERAQTSFLEISTPIVPIYSGVAVLPLIGELSEERAQVILEQTLRKAVDLKLDYLFIDLSGVITMDTMVSHEIIKIVNSLSILGIQSILTGIRPEISRTIVNLGIQFKTESRGTLKQAVQEFIINRNLQPNKK